MPTPSAAELPAVAKPVAAERNADWLPISLIALGVGSVWFIASRYLSAEWSFNEQYNYGWFVPFFAGYLFWLRWEDRPSPDVGGQRSEVSKVLVFALIAMSLLLLLPLRVFEFGSADWRPLGWVHVTAAAAITLSMIYLAGGARWVRHFSFPVLFLFVAVPWIGAIEEPIVQGLMRIIAASAAETLALFGIPAEVQGNLIRLPSGLVGVSEACSGVRSLQTSLTIGLLFGELKRLRIGGRVLLVASAIGIALFANFLRATFLVWIASSQTTAAVKQWHDAAGYAIVVLVFVGTMWIAGRFRNYTQKDTPERAEANNPQSALRSPQSRYGRSLVTLGIALFIWSCLVEVGAESWYRFHERNAVPRGSWSARWPEKASNYHEIPIDSEVRNLLRFDSGREVTWESGGNSIDRAVHYMFFMRWNPGSGTILRARAHRPDICLPAAGWTQVGQGQIRDFEVGSGRSLPFHRFEFVKPNGHVLHATAYFTLHEDVAHEGETGADAAAGLYSNWDWADRWRVVRNGIRNRGQQVLEEITVTGSRVDEKVMDDQFAQLVPQLVEAK